MSKQVGIPSAAGEIPAFLWVPEGGTGPGIVLFQEIFGVSDYIRRRAQDLADLGYVVLAPAVYWRLGAESVPTGPTMLEDGVGLAGRVDWSAAVGDGIAAVEWLRGHEAVDGGVGIVGFCFGGGLGYNVAAYTEPDCLVSYYGSALPGLVDLVPVVTAPSLHHFGLADAYIDAATVQRIAAVVTTAPDTVVHTYDGADHAFDNDDFPLYHEQASAKAWAVTVDFLGERLPVAPS